jgi:ribosomal protein S18 acetylase RimI-like enzyme
MIRSFLASDAEAVNAVAVAAFAQYEGVYSDWDVLQQGVRRTADLAQQGELIVAENENRKIVGAVAYFPPHSPRAEFFDAAWAIIRMLVVHPDARGTGIGRKLTEECLRRARRDGAAYIALHTSPKMETALAMYLRMGFQLEKHLPDRYGVPYGLYLRSLEVRQANGASS